MKTYLLFYSFIGLFTLIEALVQSDLQEYPLQISPILSLLCPYGEFTQSYERTKLKFLDLKRL